MLHRLTGHARGNAVAYLALFVALGGTSYAALRLPANSVGERQLKRSAVTASRLAPSAVTSSAVRDGSLLARDFRAGQLPRGEQGPQGPAGTAGTAGPAGAVGPAGPAGPGARWVTAKGDGSVLAQSGGIAVTRFAAGNYFLDFGENVQGKALLVSFHDDGFLGGSTGISPCGGSPWRDCSFGGAQVNTPNHAMVYTANQTNTAVADHAFTAVMLR